MKPCIMILRTIANMHSSVMKVFTFVKSGGPYHEWELLENLAMT